jgi:hypothetical protein
MTEHEYNELGLDPLMAKPLKDLVRDIPKRLMALVSKVLSFKMVVLAGSWFLVYSGRLESWAFIAVVIIVLFERAGLKFLKDIRK